MTVLRDRLLRVLSIALSPGERNAVLGDLAESREPTLQAAGGVLGLVLRRQAEAWSHPRPWFVAAGLAVPLGVLLGQRAARAAAESAVTVWLYANNWDWTLLANPAFQYDFPRIAAELLFSYLTLALVAWLGGFLLGAVSRQALPTLAPLFLLAVFLSQPITASHPAQPAFPDRGGAPVFALAFYRAFFPPLLQALLTAFPTLAGMSRGRRIAFPQLTRRLTYKS